MKEIKDVIAKNILSLRQENNLTQSQLAEKLNYTDKSVSKWENGDTSPSIEVLKEIADIFNVTLDFMVTENPDTVFERKKEPKNIRTNKIVITLLGASFIWLIATTWFIYSLTLYNNTLWFVFVFGVPATCVELLGFNRVWGKRIYSFILYSLLIWSLLAAVFCYCVYNNQYPWAIFIIGVPVQIAIGLWSQLKPVKKEKKL